MFGIEENVRLLVNFVKSIVMGNFKSFKSKKVYWIFLWIGLEWVFLIKLYKFGS